MSGVGRFVQIAVASDPDLADVELYALDSFGGVWRYDSSGEPGPTGVWRKMPDRRIPPASEAVDEDEEPEMGAS